MINETDQRLEIPETNPHIYGQLIFEEGAKKTHWKKESLQLMMLRKLNIPMKKNETRPLSYTTHRS